MDKINEQFDTLVKRIFGPDARLDGAMGSPTHPGQVRILVDHRVIGTGPTF